MKVVLTVGIFTLLAGCKGPQVGGTEQTNLAACPNKKNCVSSQAPVGSPHYIAAITLPQAWSQTESMQVLRATVAKLQGQVHVATDHYLWATFTTKLGFVDDLECLFTTGPGASLQVRSLSRLGYYDFGVNRARVERLRAHINHLTGAAMQHNPNAPTPQASFAYEPHGKALLEFWFANEKAWFSHDPQVDAVLHQRFADLYQAALAHQLDHWDQAPESCLALIILLDQLSRNLFRGTGDMFQADAQALKLALAAIDKQWDRQFTDDKRRAFFYLPLMHAEDLALQARCIELFEQTSLQTSLQYAKAHHEVIAKFGRFPHRNALLNRPSTPEELAFLQHHSGF